MRYQGRVVRAVLALAITAAPAAVTTVTAAPLAPDAVVSKLAYAPGRAGDVLSFTQSVTPATPVNVEQQAVLLGTKRTAVPRRADRDPDGSLTVTLAPDQNPVYFTGEPVAARGSVFPFLWAREGGGRGLSALTPPLTYHASVSSLRWAFVPAPIPKPSRTRGRLVLETTGVTRTAVGFSGAGPADRVATVTTVAGVVGALGGDVTVPGDLDDHPKKYVLRAPLPRGTFAGDGAPFGFTLAVLPQTANAFVNAWVQRGADRDTLLVGVELAGRVPQLVHGTVDGERVARQGIPFVATFVSKAYDATPVVSASPSLAGAVAVVRAPDGTVTRGRLPAGPVSLTEPLLPTYGVACGYAFGDTGALTADRVAMGDDFRGRHPVARGWHGGGRRRSAVPALAAVGLDVDGAVTSLATATPEVRALAHRVRWGDDSASVLDVPTTSFYGAFTDSCSYTGSDKLHRATAVHLSPGMKPGTGRRLLYVTGAVVAEVRLDAAPDSRVTYTKPWPVLRVTARVWSLDGQPHRVRVRALAEVAGAALQVLDPVTGNSSRVEHEVRLPSEQVIALSGDGEHFRLVAGVIGAGTRGATDAAGRYAGPSGTLTAVAPASTVVADPAPDPGVPLGARFDLHLASAPDAASAGPTFHTGFVVALIADDVDPA